MDRWLIAAWFLFFVLPAAAMAIGVAFLEEQDSTDERGWRGGRRDPMKLVAYDESGRIRPTFRPAVYVGVGLYFAILAWFTLLRMGW